MQTKTNAVVGADQANDPALPDEGATFEDLMKMAGFSDKSVAILQQNDFKSVDSLTLLAQDPGAVCELQLPIQQALLLTQYVAALTTASPGGALPGFLQAAQKMHINTEAQGQHTGMLGNLQACLIKGGCASTSKHRDSVDFVSFVPPLVENKVDTDIPHLHTTGLCNKSYCYTQKSANHKVSDKAVCHRYNSAGGCTYGENCKYAHRYNEPSCSKTHSRSQAHASNPSVKE